MYQDSHGDWLHDQKGGRFCCGPVLPREYPCTCVLRFNDVEPCAGCRRNAELAKS
jgi:hypothetical protein